MNRPIDTSTYFGKPSRSSLGPSEGVRRLARRLRVQPRAVYALARELDVDLHWLDVCSSTEVTTQQPASWSAMVALGYDPVTGEGLA